MRWFDRVTGWLLPRRVQREHDFGGAIGKLPYVEFAQHVRLHVTADDRVFLDDRAVPLTDLERELRAVCRPGVVVHYSRENPAEVSAVAPAVIDLLCQVGLPYTFPREATATLDRVLSERGGKSA